MEFEVNGFSVLTEFICLEIEMARRRAETNLRGYNARERIQEDAEKQKVCECKIH